MYHFTGRLIINQQTRIQSNIESPGFISLIDCVKWCKSNLFNFTIYHLVNGKKIQDYSEN